MFGYVTPCKMELKIKDYERFKSYYCGLCTTIKSNYGNLPRMSLNYDMTFLAVLLDSLTLEKCTFKSHRCLLHPLKKRITIINNKALDYAAFCNVVLTYYKLVDNVVDDKSKLSKIGALLLKRYVKKNSTEALKNHENYIKNSLDDLFSLESFCEKKSLDEVSHPFADLTGYILSSYVDNLVLPMKEMVKDDIYWLGYNLGKWIYIIDAWDDLEKDIEKGKFNVINNIYNESNLAFAEFSDKIKDRVEFTLVSCASQCIKYLNEIPIFKNEDILQNILQYGLMERMDIVFKRSEGNDAKSL